MDIDERPTSGPAGRINFDRITNYSDGAGRGPTAASASAGPCRGSSPAISVGFALAAVAGWLGLGGRDYSSLH